MYPNYQPGRHPAQTLTLNGQYLPPAYDFSGYHHSVSGVTDPSTTTWNPVYTPREENPYSFPGSSPSAGQVSYTSPELSNAPSAAGGEGSLTPYIGKTRTKDKYRVVYTDHQRLELEKEFQCNRYITMRRKSDLSVSLGLSERQVKIWFQNRRAKERKINRKKLQHSQQASTTTPTPPSHTGPCQNISTNFIQPIKEKCS
uniref:Caudal type homeobox 1a n=1 Tax=Cyprinodon variegatus TaxID=28743 RepID=A0A3Q2CTH8_CYPVA